MHRKKGTRDEHENGEVMDMFCIMYTDPFKCLFRYKLMRREQIHIQPYLDADVKVVTWELYEKPPKGDWVQYAGIRTQNSDEWRAYQKLKENRNYKSKSDTDKAEIQWMLDVMERFCYEEPKQQEESK